MPIRAVLFDKDGTLLDYHRTWVPTNRLVAQRIAGPNPNHIEQLLAIAGHEPQTNTVAPNCALAAGSAFDVARVSRRAVDRRVPTTTRRGAVEVACAVGRAVERSTIALAESAGPLAGVTRIGPVHVAGPGSVAGRHFLPTAHVASAQRCVQRTVRRTADRATSAG